MSHQDNYENRTKKRFDAMQHLKSVLSQKSHPLLACVRTYGCQQNVADSERIKGMLAEMGYGFTDHTEEADLVLFNTCAVREHAELKVYGNIGALKSLKKKKPDMLIIMCGCMMQQETVQNQLKKKYKHVDIVFGPSMIADLPLMIETALLENQKIFTREEQM